MRILPEIAPPLSLVSLCLPRIRLRFFVHQGLSFDSIAQMRACSVRTMLVRGVRDW